MTTPGFNLSGAARGALIAALGITVYGMMALTFVDVAGRYLFNAPLGGAKELTEVLLALMVFGAAPLVTTTRSHITTALFESAMKGGILKVRNGVIAIVSALCCAVLAWRLWVQAVAMAELKGGTPLLGVPLAPIFYAMAVLSGICAVLTLVVAAAPPKPASEVPT
jgi:TRAP-type C4-dicarboxylate transport system permease small subunit